MTDQQNKPQEARDQDKVTHIFAAPRYRNVPHLTDDEITKLRRLLQDFDAVAVACPIASRALSKR